MSLAEWPDPLSLQEKVETFVDCRECGHHFKVVVKESVTVGELEGYICPDCQSDYQVTDDPASTNAFDVFKSTFIN